MQDYLIHVIIPMIVSNFLHMIIVKKNFLSSMNRAISVQLFGQNKTWRGFFLLPILNGLALMILCDFTKFLSLEYSFLIGAILGLAYMIFELPNSWVKRRLGIASGTGQKHWWSVLMDKTDSAFGVSLAAMFLFKLSLLQAGILFFAASLTHLIFSYLLVWVKVKKSL